METWRKVLIGVALVFLAYPFVWPVVKGCRMPQSVPERFSPPVKHIPRVVESGVVEIPAGEGIFKEGPLLNKGDRIRLKSESKTLARFWSPSRGQGTNIPRTGTLREALKTAPLWFEKQKEATKVSYQIIR